MKYLFFLKLASVCITATHICGRISILFFTSFPPCAMPWRSANLPSFFGPVSLCYFIPGAGRLMSISLYAKRPSHRASKGHHVVVPGARPEHSQPVPYLVNLHTGHYPIIFITCPIRKQRAAYNAGGNRDFHAI